jgi:hypothetical protein
MSTNDRRVSATVDLEAGRSTGCRETECTIEQRQGPLGSRSRGTDP